MCVSVKSERLYRCIMTYLNRLLLDSHLMSYFWSPEQILNAPGKGTWYNFTQDPLGGCPGLGLLGFYELD